MADILDYIAWRGDITIDTDGFNEVDGAVLARFAYIPFEYFKNPLPEGPVTVRELAELALGDESLRENERWKLSDDVLLAEMAGSRRFGPLRASFFANKLDSALETQFAAVTLELSDGRHAVLFRGTDNTLVGWKEDLNMSYMFPIPGQIMAKDYLTEVSHIIKGSIIICGHSKGGNLAVYAGAFCGEDISGRIEAIYNYDGPGFYEEVLSSEGYGRIYPKVRTFVPQFSVVGMLLGREEESAVVHSTKSGLHQHDIYTWEVRGPRFVHLGTVTGGSRFVDSAVKGWISEMTPEQFERFAGAIYSVLSETNAVTLHEMRENWFDSAKSMVHSIGGMDPDTREAAIEAIKLLLRNAGREAKEKYAEPLIERASRRDTEKA